MLFALKANAQILYSEDFDNIPGSTSGGVGSYFFPNNILLRNVDNLIPNTARLWVTNAWVRGEDFDNLSDTCAVSTSWYTPFGTANDFMWLPSISVPNGTTTILTWNARALASGYEDGYEVRIMTVAPTGGVGVIGNQITNSTVLYSTPAESLTWVTRSVDISAYAGQNVYIGFRNNSFDKDILYIDDIQVEALSLFDATVTSATVEYTQIPVGQGIALKGTVANVGANSLTNVSLKVDIYDASNSLVHSATSTPVASIAPLGNATFTIPPFTPSVAGNYTIKYNHIQNEVDGNLLNDELTKTISVSNNLYARDNSNVTSALGIGAGNGGYLGQSFTLTAPAYLYSISTFYTQGYLQGSLPLEPYGSAIWNTDVNGTPTTIFAVTDTNYYPNTNPLYATSPIFGGTVLMPAGTYVVTAIEFDSTLQVGQTDEIFTTGKHWVNWPTSPLGGWGNVEAFGTPFQKAFAIRMDLGATAFPLSSEALLLKGSSSDKQFHLLTWTNQEKAGFEYEYILQMSGDGKNWRDVHKASTNGKDELRSLQFKDAKGVTEKAFYRVRVMNQDNELKYSNMITLFNSNKEVLVDIFPNPAKDNITIQTNRFKNTTCSIYDVQGKLLLSQPLNAENSSISLQGISSGVYYLKLQNGSDLIYSDKLIIQ